MIIQWTSSQYLNENSVMSWTIVEQVYKEIPVFDSPITQSIVITSEIDD